jgi:hypothetical protein
MIRPSSKCNFSFVLLVASLAAASAACGSRPSKGPGFATAPDLPEGPRRPDGVVVDPTPELPRATEAAQPASTIVALKPPLPEKAARALVAAFFRAVVSEDLDAIADLSMPDAVAPTKSRGSSASILDHWRGRMRHFRYRTLAGEVLYQEADVEFYRYDDLDVIAIGRPPRPPEMTRSDLLLRVPLTVVRAAGSDRAFGDDILFLLRRDKDRFRIRQVLEDFQIP